MEKFFHPILNECVVHIDKPVRFKAWAFITNVIRRWVVKPHCKGVTERYLRNKYEQISKNCIPSDEGVSREMQILRTYFDRTQEWQMARQLNPSIKNKK